MCRDSDRSDACVTVYVQHASRTRMEIVDDGRKLLAHCAAAATTSVCDQA